MPSFKTLVVVENSIHAEFKFANGLDDNLLLHVVETSLKLQKTFLEIVHGLFLANSWSGVDTAVDLVSVYLIATLVLLCSIDEQDHKFMDFGLLVLGFHLLNFVVVILV